MSESRLELLPSQSVVLRDLPTVSCMSGEFIEKLQTYSCVDWVQIWQVLPYIRYIEILTLCLRLIFLCHSHASHSRLIYRIGLQFYSMLTWQIRRHQTGIKLICICIFKASFENNDVVGASSLTDLHLGLPDSASYSAISPQSVVAVF